MKKSLMIVNIVFSCLTVLSIIFAGLFYWSSSTDQPRSIDLSMEIMLAISGMVPYLGVFITGCFMFYLGRGNGLVRPLIKVDSILDIIIGAIVVIGTVICHAISSDSHHLEIFTMVMGIGSISLIILSVIAYKQGTDCASNDI